MTFKSVGEFVDSQYSKKEIINNLSEILAAFDNCDNKEAQLNRTKSVMAKIGLFINAVNSIEEQTLN